MKRCRGCSEEKPLEQYTQDSRNPDGLEHHCRECKKAKREKRRRVQKGPNCSCHVDAMGHSFDSFLCCSNRQGLSGCTQSWFAQEQSPVECAYPRDPREKTWRREGGLRHTEYLEEREARNREVLSLHAQGLSRTRIAQQVHLSPQYVGQIIAGARS